MMHLWAIFNKLELYKKTNKLFLQGLLCYALG